MYRRAAQPTKESAFSTGVLISYRASTTNVRGRSEHEIPQRVMAVLIVSRPHHVSSIYASRGGPTDRAQRPLPPTFSLRAASVRGDSHPQL